MNLQMILGIILPLIGTSLGAAAVYFVRKGTLARVNNPLSGFASGVMMAASVWSLIIPAVETCSFLGAFGFMPVLAGLWVGIGFMLCLEKYTSRLLKKQDSGQLLFFLAVVVHNIPEGMAVGASFAGASEGTAVAALLLSVGMALQNIPEGAIISAPLEGGGMTRKRAFIYGVLSGVVEPIAAVFTLLFSSFVTFLLPYLLGFAAGAMIYVTVKELLPEAGGRLGVLWFFVGFSLMMVLDIALG